MDWMNATWVDAWAESSRTAVGFFWKAGWAFVMGYAVSAMIQAFVPRRRLTRHMGDAGLRSISLATVFGSVSSSCSFAALAAARSLVLKGAHFVAAVAFMFASTNLVIELGVLIAIFLGWQFVVAELVGGLLLIAISTTLMRWSVPRSWLDTARERLEEEADDEEDFDWRDRITSVEGWRLVGHRFVQDWKMVWEEIAIGFSVAGFVAVLVPASFWATIFLSEAEGLPQWVVLLENAAVAPFVAAATFIGSMGNIPLATVLASNGVLFAGIMGFIYSDLMVPPLVAVNARYYGPRLAFTIAGVMFVSIVITAMVLHLSFEALGIVPESGRAMEEVSRFAIDYTFWLNLAMAAVAVVLVKLHRDHEASAGDAHGGHGHGGHDHGDHDHGSAGTSIKRWAVYGLLVVVSVGVGLSLLAG